LVGNESECPKCRRRTEVGFMEVGFVIDQGDTIYTRVSQWAQGPPEQSFWLGVNLKGRDVVPITTFRCVRCGFLEAYAR
jgi:hypothetical protein